MGKKSKHAEVSEEVEESVVTEEKNELTYEEKAEKAVVIAHPMASRKLAKRIFKLGQKAKSKKALSVGLKIVKKNLQKKMKGYVVLAGDADPLDTVSHFPVLCEENNTPYVWVPTRRDLGLAVGSGAALCAFIKPDESYEETYDQVYEKIKSLPLPPSV